MHLAEDRRRLGAAAALGAGLLAALILGSAPAAAAPTDSDSRGAVLVLDAPGTDAKKARRRAARALVGVGADGGDPAGFLLLSELLASSPLRVLAVPDAQPCPGGAPRLPPSDLAARLDRAEADAQFGSFDEAGTALASLAAALPCLDGVPAPRDLHRLWFLQGALAHQQARPDEARRLLARAVQVPGEHPFDTSWPPALQALMAEAREEVLSRRSSRAVLLAEGVTLHLDGQPLAPAEGRVDVPLREGLHLLQLLRDGVVSTVLLDLEARPLSAALPAFAAYDGPGLRGAVAALAEAPDSAGGRAAAGALQAEAAVRGLDWILVATEPGEPVLRVDPLSRRTEPFGARLARGDAFSRRARLMLAGELRAQAAAGTPVNYGAFTLGLWVSVAPPLKLGSTLSFQGTRGEPPPGKTACCLLPELAFRARIEWPPEGLFRPLAELGIGIVWPDGTGSSTSAAIEGLGGFLLVPGIERRVGISLAAGAGGLAEIGAYFRLRAAAELRF